MPSSEVRGRASAVEPSALTSFLGAAGVARSAEAARGAEVVELRARDRRPARPGASPAPRSLSAFEPPVEPVVPPRVALLALGHDNFSSTAALAIAIADAAARDSDSPGAIATVDRARVRIGGRRRRHAVALRGFDPLGRVGRVSVLDAEDAEAVSIAASGSLPVVCAVSVGDGLAEQVDGICPSSLLIAADAAIDGDYAGLLAADLGRRLNRAPIGLLRYSTDRFGSHEAVLSPDRQAAARLRFGLPPSGRSRANAEVAVALLARA